MADDSPPGPRRISDVTYAIPFGRYVGSSVVSPGADEVLVGREGQRAYFIDLLISSGRQGSYLVTGRRGSGKTSFVKHCIAEYEASVFQRFLRNNVGRGLLDRAIVLICWMLVLVGGLILSEVAQLLVPLTRGGDSHRPLLWLVLAPLGLALLYPALYARAVIAIVVDNFWRSDRVKETRFPEIFATVSVSGFLLLLWFLLPELGAPAWSLSAILGGIGTLYLGVQAFSYAKLTEEGAARRSSGALIAAYATGAAIYGTWVWLVDRLAGPQAPLALTVGGSIFVAAGLVLRGIYQRERMGTVDEPVAGAMRRGGNGYRNSGFTLIAALALAPYLLLIVWSPWTLDEANTLFKTVVADLVFAFVAASLSRLHIRRLYWTAKTSKHSRVRPPNFVPRPLAILSAGAAFSCVIALQAAHPVLVALTDSPRNAAFFTSRTHEASWLVLATLCLGLFHLIQYEWILRPFLQPREEQPLDPEPAMLWDDRDPIGDGPKAGSPRTDGLWRRHRELAALTLPWAVYRLWLPTIAIAVNLGLDVKLGAGQIIQAMLAGLREKYHAVFTSWNSGLANLGRFVGLLALLTLTTLAGEIWFGLPSMTRIAEIETPNGDKDGTSACSILALTRVKRSPELADYLCDLGETWFHLVYFNFVPEPLGEVTDGRNRLLVFTLLPYTAQRAPDPAFFQTFLNFAPAPLGTISGGGNRFPHFSLWPPWPHVAQSAPALATGGALAARWAQVTPQGLHWCLYHAFLFVGFFVVGRWFLHRLPLLPYRENLRRIDDLLDAMSARTRVTASPSVWEPARWVYSLFSERVKELEREPLDPRTVELAFLQILEEIQRGGLAIPGIARHHLSLPGPEITFLFDELDKLGSRVDPEEGRFHSIQQEIAVASAEQDRTLKLRALLSDLKNILATAQARFIFIGGRNLHDEWLADQTTRQPLLTNIFNAEVYLPALFTDRPAQPEDAATQEAGRRRKTRLWLDRRIQEYVAYQHSRAENQYREWALKRLRPSFGISVAQLAQERFVGTARESGSILRLEVFACPGVPGSIEACCAPTPAAVEQGAAHGRLTAKPLITQSEPLPAGPEASVADGGTPSATAPVQTKTPRRLWLWLRRPPPVGPSNPPRISPDSDLSPGEGEAVLRDLICFLTHRSMGNPKRLKELLAQFVRPVWQVALGDDRWQLHCRHVLRLRDAEVFRIQLIASIYRLLAGTFEARMVVRDDKLAVSIFFLTDFLFKFHRRAFSWSNLERVDELAHIHRAPDMRDIQEEMVDLFSERFLHRVLNGMYSFRFRSDVASEVEFLSRRSAAEMAALNFTLDESQSLKAQYFAALRQFGGHLAEGSTALPAFRPGANPGLVAGLGELYEFDQEFETARHYYSQAIQLLDAEMTSMVDGREAIQALLAGNDSGAVTALRTFLSWSEARLRLMLQIGMTYEIARNFERAEAEYRTARTLSRAVIKACVPKPVAQAGEVKDKIGASGRVHTIKHLSILFQPLFAQAWVSQKIVGAIDTSLSLTERALWQIRKNLPFVSQTEPTDTNDPVNPPYANFALTLSQLHKKAADLYFFKGRQAVTFERLHRIESLVGDRSTDGYLLRAHYHYAVSLHELRRFLRHRIQSSGYRLSIAENPQPTLELASLPDFARRAIGGTINDMAEATLARVSLMRLIHEHKGQQAPAAVPTDYRFMRLEDKTFEWFGGNGENSRIKLSFDIDLGGRRPFRIVDLSNWLGAWVKRERKTFDDESLKLVTFVGPDPEEARLAVSLHLARAGARFLAAGGYLEDAARELLQVVGTVTRYLWWLRALEAIFEWFELSSDTDKKGLAPILAPLQTTGLLGPAVMKSDAASSFWRALVDFAIDSLSEAAELFAQSRFKVAQRESKRREFERGHAAQGFDRYQVGVVIPPEAVGHACSLGLWLDQRQEEHWRQRSQDVADLVAGWRGVDRPSGQPAGANQSTGFGYRRVLRQTLRRHRFPMLNRIYGLKTLTESATLTSLDGSLFGLQVQSWLEEMLDVNATYAAPFHFTPFDSGITCALFWLRHRLVGTASDADLEPFYRAAERDLRVSEEMYTMRRAFYESISDLYYLYDDFNDRQIHYKHAIQMAGAEMTCLLRKLLEVSREGSQSPGVTGDPLQAPLWDGANSPMLTPTPLPLPGLVGLHAYPDDRDPSTFYLLPARPRVPLDEAGRPLAQLTLFGRQGARGFEIEGGLVSLTVDLAVTAEERRRAEAALAGLKGQPVRIAAMQWPGGRVEVTLSREVKLEGRPSLYGENRAALQLRLSAAAAKELEAAWKRGLPEATATFELDVPGIAGTIRRTVIDKLDVQDGAAERATRVASELGASRGASTLRIQGALVIAGPLGEVSRLTT